MNEETKIKWLRIVIIVKIIVMVLLWGLPLWLAPASLLGMLGVAMPADPFFMRMFGCVMIGLVFLYWFGYQDPVKNRDIIKYGVIDNTLSFLTMLGVGFTTGITNPITWVSAGLVLLFAIAFYVLMPAKK
jgi:hypothetical protein